MCYGFHLCSLDVDAYAGAVLAGDWMNRVGRTYVPASTENTNEVENDLRFMSEWNMYDHVRYIV